MKGRGGGGDLLILKEFLVFLVKYKINFRS